MDIARDHAHVVAAEQLHQIEELFADQRFNRRRVIRCLAKAHGHEVHAQRDQAFAAACGSAQDDVVAHHERHERLLLVRPQLDTAVGNPVGERLERLLLGELRVCVVQMVGKRAQLAGLVAFGLRSQRLDDVLAFERMNISHRAVPLQSMQNLMRLTCCSSKSNARVSNANCIAIAQANAPAKKNRSPKEALYSPALNNIEFS